jgi:excinuclease UvrABC ATPase subunit
VDFQAMLDMMPCPSCLGAKLRKEALAVHVVCSSTSSGKSKKTQEGLQNIADIEEKYNIHELQSLPISDLVKVMKKFVKGATKKQDLIKKIVTPLLDRAQTIEEL